MAQPTLNSAGCDRRKKEDERFRQVLINLSKHIDAYELQTEELTDIPSAVSKLFIKNLRRVITRIDMSNGTLDTPQLRVTITNGQVDSKKRGKRKSSEDSFDDDHEEQQQQKVEKEEQEEAVENNVDSSNSKIMKTSPNKTRSNRSRSISSSSSTKSTLKVGRLGGKNTKSDEFRPTSSPSSPRKKSPTKKELRKDRPSPQKKMKFDGPEEQSGIGEAFLFPKWLTQVIPKPTPYFPQVGDDLVYFRQGHELYTKMVEELQVYSISKMMKKQLPFVQHPDLPPEISVRVIKINYELLPPRLVNLKLARTNWETGELIGGELLVRYHDMADVMDFLVLRQIYDKAVDHHWSVGDRFRHLSKTSKTWWLGTVTSSKPFTAEYVDSNFLSYEVSWDDRNRNTDDDDGDEEKTDNLSPWDMDPISDDLDNCSTDDVGCFVYNSKPDDWSPGPGQDDVDECQRILRIFQNVMDLPIASNFLGPTDYKIHPSYAFSVEYPIDLSTIKERLVNSFYRRVDAVATDVNYIFINANKFPIPVDDYVKNAKIVRDLLTQILEDKGFEDLDEAYELVLENYNKEVDEIVNNNSKGRVRRDNGNKNSSAKKNRRPIKTTLTTRKSTQGKKSNSRVKTKQKEPVAEGTTTSESWPKDCQKLLQSTWSKGNAAPFRYPVSKTDYPDYLDVISTPMCLNVVKENLKDGKYTKPSEFHRDMMLIFQNSHDYHKDPTAVIRSMTQRLQTSYEEEYHKIFVDKDQPKNDSAPAHTPTTTKKTAVNGKMDQETEPVGKPAESPVSRQESKDGKNRRLSGRQVKDKIDYSQFFSEKMGTTFNEEKKPNAKGAPTSRKRNSLKNLISKKNSPKKKLRGVKKSPTKKSEKHESGSDDVSSDPDVIILE